VSLLPDDDFVRDHEGMVRALAKEVAFELGAATLIDDLVGYGMEGLLEARRQFDPTRGTPFGGFARKRVRYAMFDGAEEMRGSSRKRHARVVRVGKEIREEEAAELDLRGDDPTFDEIAASFDRLYGKETSSMILDRLAEEQRTPEAKVIAALDGARLRRAITRLDDEPRKLLEDYYYGQRSVEDIAGDLGVSRAQFWRMHSAALLLLREALG
jgi:RNA polymerase sigma factor for flagellar operon FliA